jgi:hypothetical protein
VDLGNAIFSNKCIQHLVIKPLPFELSSVNNFNTPILSISCSKWWLHSLPNKGMYRHCMNQSAKHLCQILLISKFTSYQNKLHRISCCFIKCCRFYVRIINHIIIESLPYTVFFQRKQKLVNNDDETLERRKNGILAFEKYPNITCTDYAYHTVK